LKIYPIIYSLALYFHIEHSPSLRLTLRRFQLVISFILTTLVLNGFFYYYYGYEYLHETYLYHIIRRDARHNFSPYFYLTYLSPQLQLLSFITFIPQVFNTLLLSYRLYDRLELCLFALTFSFVTFNKVTTSQYFLWYLIFIPILLPHIQLKWKKLFMLLVAWLAAQAWWLYGAYQLEFKGKNTFVQIWFASIVFGFVNVTILCMVMYNYRQIVVAPEKKND
jgi:phosphatidylinositol glycan class M